MIASTVSCKLQQAAHSFGAGEAAVYWVGASSSDKVRFEWAILCFKLHLKHQILPLFNLDCLWCLLEQTPAAGAGSWLESGTFTRRWVMETNVRLKGRGSGGQDQITGFHLRLCLSLSRLCQKSQRLRETALIKTGKQILIEWFQTFMRPWMHYKEKGKNDGIWGCQNTGQLKKLIH